MSWTAVARSADVLCGMAMPACVQSTDLAIWRSHAGHVHAWGDRCPHRGMRLSHGFVRGETLACIYHGWQYDTVGSCVSIPAHPDLEPPKSICATTYACAEQNGLIWVSLHATDAPLPDYSDLTAVLSLALAVPEGAVNVPDDLTVVIQPVTAATCMMHVLAAPDADLYAVADRAETVRDTLERSAA
ncbi:Rieske (2Fe-2S) protein [Roseobacter sp.]|uniref:Rieske (2Fe-2S) protein n=1 Tax=Roseobacter sp. TaxID=1907202 RepID=UPI0032985320